MFGLAFAGVKCQKIQSVQSSSALLLVQWVGVGVGAEVCREWEGAGAGAGAGMSEWPLLARWRRWTGLGWGLPHCMIGPPNFPSYNLSTCNLPHQRPQPFRFSHLLPSPSQLCDKPQSFSRDFFTSKQSRKTKAHPVSVPFQSGQSPSTHPPASFATPFPKTNSPRPRRHRPGLVAR